MNENAFRGTHQEYYFAGKFERGQHQKSEHLN